MATESQPDERFESEIASTCISLLPPLPLGLYTSICLRKWNLFRETFFHFAIMLLVAGAIFFTNLGQSRLWDRDEPRNAGCAAEMMARGDWVVPIFNDELRHQKPVLLYWLMMSAYSIFGVNEFSARFWSALLATGTTLITYGLIRRLTAPYTGLIAAVALSTSLMFGVAGRAATPDSVLIFFSSLAMLLYVLGTIPSRTFVEIQKTQTATSSKGPRSWFPTNNWIVIGMYVSMGLAVLAKGPVGFFLPMAMIGLFMLIQRAEPIIESGGEPIAGQTKFSNLWIVKKALNCARIFAPMHFGKTLWAMRPFLAAMVVLLIALPWFLLVHHQTQGDFTQLFFVGEHFGRATAPMENHSGGIWFYPLAILVGFFPWSVLWGPALAGILLHQKRDKGNDSPNANLDVRSNEISDEPGNKILRDLDTIQIANTFLICWVAVQVCVFSLAQTKLPSYVTPCYPALAGLVAICLARLGQFEKQEIRLQETRLKNTQVHVGWYYASLSGLIFSGLLIIVGLGFAASKFLPQQTWLAFLGLIPLLSGIVMVSLLRNRLTQKIPALFAVSAFLFAFCLFGFGPVSLDREQQSHLLVGELAKYPSVSVATFGVLESSWVFYANRPIYEIATTQGSEGDSVDELADDVAINSIALDRLDWKPKPRLSVASFLNQNPGALFIVAEDELATLRSKLPEGYDVIQTAEYFLKNKKLFLLRNQTNTKVEIGNRPSRKTLR
ncbi:MAG: ArnT family glycosyltransferase [Mariniblastus sp.]